MATAARPGRPEARQPDTPEAGEEVREPHQHGGQLPPAYDLHETPEEFRIDLEVAGANPEDLAVELTGDLLTIRGRQSSEAVEFKRDFRLPQSVDLEKIQSKLHRGVLTVSLPKLQGRTTTWENG